MDIVSFSIPYLYIIHLTIIGVRVGATLLFAPIWGHPGLPQYLRVMMVYSIAAGVSAITPFNPETYNNPGLIIPTEFLIGMLLSVGVRIAFAGLHMGGHLISTHLGFSAAQTIDPSTMNRSSLVSGFLTMMGMVLLLASNQHHVMFRALANSYVVFPIGTAIAPQQWFGALIEASKQIFIIGWKIALPVFIATFIIDIAVAFVSRMQPQINTMVVTAPLKIVVGLMVLGASLTFMSRAMGSVIETMVLKR